MGLFVTIFIELLERKEYFLEEKKDDKREELKYGKIPYRNY